MKIEDAQLKRFMVESGLVSRRDIEAAEAECLEKGQGIGEVLVSQGKLSGDDLHRMRAYALGLPFVDLRSTKIDYKVLSAIPEPIARTHNIVAFGRTGDSLEVALLDVEDLEAIRFIEGLAGVSISPRMASADSIRAALVQYQKGLKSEFGDLIKQEVSTLGGKKDAASAVRTVDTLLKHALSQRASDVHVDPLEKELSVRYRIDGAIRDAMVLPKDAEHAVLARIRELCALPSNERRAPQDGRFKIERHGERVSVRVSIVPTVFGEKAVLRLSSENAIEATPESLGFHGKGLEALHGALKRKAGLLLVAGPKRSGSSSTLYTLIDILNLPDTSVSTIEDPVERHIPRIHQTQVRPEIGLTFAAGLRAILRQDPDAVMIGDIRDEEVAHLAASAALAGRSVLAGMHSRSAAEALVRLRDMKVDASALSSTVSVCIGQRLARRIVDPKDRRPLSRSELSALGKVVDLDRIISIFRSEGLIGPKDGWGKVLFSVPKSDSKEAYKGFIGLLEVLALSPAVKELVLKGAKKADIEAQAKKEGMLSLIEDGIFKAAQGFTSIEEVLKAVSE